MEYYILMLVLILLSAFFQKKGYRYVYGRKGKSVELSLLVSCMILFFFAAMRAVSVGADTRQYQIVFELCSEEKWSALAASEAHQGWFNLKDIEIGYKFYNKLLSCIWDNPQMITIANSFFIMFPLYRLIKKYSSNYWLSIFLFFTMGFYQTSLNLTPSAIASLIALNGLEYIRKKKILPYVGCILLASVFHYSAFLFLPLYFCDYLKLTAKRFWGILLGAFAVVTLAFSILVFYLYYIVPERYQVYLRGSIKKEQILVYVVQLLLISYCIWKEKGDELFWKKNQNYLWFFLAESVSYFLAMYASSGFSRISFLFSPLIVITIPRLLQKGSIRKKGVGNTDIGKGILRIDKRALLIVGYCIFVYLVRITINNIGTTMPYQFCF